jgi:hypothetical protein
MIKGEFDNQKRPIVEIDLHLTATTPIIHMRPIIDTGAIDTIIMPQDAGRLHLHHGNMPTTRFAKGIGGGIPGYEFNNASLIFHDTAGAPVLYYEDVLVITPDLVRYSHPAALKLPSILGREVISRWRLTLCYLNRGNYVEEVMIDPLSHD